VTARPALAAAIGAEAVLVSYAVIRLVSALFLVDPDPRGIYWTEHAGFTWRVLAAVLLGALVAFTVAQLPTEKLERLVMPGVLLAAAAIVVQALIAP
jgi:hypothetical protein